MISIMKSDEIKTVIDSKTTALLEDRGIRTGDVKRTIAFAEQANNVFVHSVAGCCLGYFRGSNTTYWVEYMREGDYYSIKTAYSHKMEVWRGSNAATKSRKTTEWMCRDCKVLLEAARVKLTYLGETFAVDFPACPRCQRILVSEKDAVENMALAEQMLEDK